MTTIVNGSIITGDKTINYIVRRLDKRFIWVNTYPEVDNEVAIPLPFSMLDEGKLSVVRR